MKTPVVSIVGRPNVGKSTLFNRIIRRREAIVDDEPGVTRDRKAFETQWEGRSFLLVDTGGYIPKTHDIIEAGVTAQVKLAMEESDLIVFLVDGTTGITDVDGDVADLLRKSEKTCILAVNKIDGPSRELDAVEFYKLGLGEPALVSALRGRAVGDLLSLIIRNLDWPDGRKGEDEADSLRLGIVGRPNVGKSTFINTILGEERMLVTEIPGTTRDSVDVRFQYKDTPITLIDTAGMRRRTHIKDSVEYYSTLRTHRVVERCDVACVFCEAKEGLTQQDLRVVREVIDARKGILLVINKWDLLDRDAENLFHVETQLDQKLQGLTFVPILRISCKTGKSVNEVLNAALEIQIERERRIPSPDINNLLEKMNQRYQHPAIQGKRIRIMYGTQVGEKPPTFVFFSNYPQLLKESYKRFLENQIRDQFGFEGTPISFLFKRK
ncbi:ribosome biogenesis GTPase Der [bacterium I07]|nr:ribosome biogenesis GTPase Der [bacterium I07]